MPDGEHLSPAERGRRGEAIAAQALEAHGYRIIEHNWRCESGEIDIVACDGETWVFVEVKTRSSEAYGSPEEAVTQSKQTRLLNAATAYLAAHELDDVAWRVDVVAIMLGEGGKVRRLAIYQDAVRADG
ncbi:MAG TPA: YraN family protein [Chloroflexi bacterium]|nr:YraN family protein [Chloroflexota bacterium]